MTSPVNGRPSRPALNLLLAGIAAAAIAVPALLVRTAPPIRPTSTRLVGLRQRVVPPVELPPVEPTEYVELAPEDARSYNASIPFASGPNPAARPFHFAGSPEALARATDCLAAAQIYEAGDDAEGERAVAQVVLNRLRHPAFPKTVCGVVFQGSERSTGCQFTFTCDGAIDRWKPSEAGWRRAREIAAMALGGSVYKPVGYATHYHTDWVVPYWSSSLDKIARVGTHLFFRWSGWWGTPPAFNRRPDGAEPAIEKIAAFSDVHKTGAALAEADAALAEADAAVAAFGGGPPTGALPDQEMTPDRDSFLVTLPPSIPPAQWPEVAKKTCGDRLYCKVLGWVDASKTPKKLPLNVAQVSSLSFSYLRDWANGLDRRLWNCREFKRPAAAQCMKVQVYDPAAAPTPAPAAVPSPTPTRGPDELQGVRRKAEAQQPAPAPAAKPTPASAS